MGDAEHDPNKEAAPTPPSLRKDGEALPQDDPSARQGTGTMKPVQFPNQKPDDYPDASRLPRTPAPADKTQAPEPDDDSDSAGKPAQTPPAAKPN